MNEFEQHIKYCLHTCNKDPVYAPYFALIQSSGYGKSRLIAELAQNTYVIYICLRSSDAHGYPLRTSVADRLVSTLNVMQNEEGALAAINWFQKFLKASVTVLIEELSTGRLRGPAQLWEMQMNPAEEKAFWVKVLEKTKSNSEDRHTPENIPHQVESIHGLNLFLCFDEARKLLDVEHETELSPFRLIRRSLKDIQWAQYGFLCAMLDTMGKLANFSPPYKRSNSERIRDERVKLLPPYIDIMTLDALNNKVADQPNRRLMFGRPLWASSICAGKTITEVIEFAKCKLLGGHQPTQRIEILFDKEEDRIAVSLALVGCLVSLDISVQSQLTHLLVGSYMATCIAVSEDRENILVIYPSEPILSEAALRLIEVTENRTFVLDRLEISLKNGLVEAGFRGELVARIILILGWQHMLSGDTLYTQEKSVRDFLNTLFGNYQTLKQRDNRLKSLKLKTTFLQSKLCLTHFVQLNDPPSCQVLKRLFERGAGAILGRNARGGDLLLPVKMNNTSEEQFSFILIQVKNYSTSGQAYTEAATTRLTPSSVFGESELANLDLPYLCFYWSLGATESNSRLQFKSWEDFEQHWGVFSLDPFKFLTEDLKTKLYALLCAYINPFDSIWKRRPTIGIEQHRANVKCFFPVEKI